MQLHLCTVFVKILFKVLPVRPASYLSICVIWISLTLWHPIVAGKHWAGPHTYVVFNREPGNHGMKRTNDFGLLKVPYSEILITISIIISLSRTLSIFEFLNFGEMFLNCKTGYFVERTMTDRQFREAISRRNIVIKGNSNLSLLK